MRLLCASDQDVVHGYVDCAGWHGLAFSLSLCRAYACRCRRGFGKGKKKVGGRTRTQLDQVPRGAHDEEADADGLADLDELLLVGCFAG